MVWRVVAGGSPQPGDVRDSDERIGMKHYIGCGYDEGEMVLFVSDPKYNYVHVEPR